MILVSSSDPESRMAGSKESPAIAGQARERFLGKKNKIDEKI